MTQVEPQRANPGRPRILRVLFELDNDGVVRANPPSFEARIGDRVVMTYAGRAAGTLYFPKADVFGGRLFEMKGEKPYTLELVVQEAATLGDYPYALYLPDVSQIAEGLSPPRMIIIPPIR